MITANTDTTGFERRKKEGNLAQQYCFGLPRGIKLSLQNMNSSQNFNHDIIYKVFVILARRILNCCITLHVGQLLHHLLDSGCESMELEVSWRQSHGLSHVLQSLLTILRGFFQLRFVQHSLARLEPGLGSRPQRLRVRKGCGQAVAFALAFQCLAGSLLSFDKISSFAVSAGQVEQEVRTELHEAGVQFGHLLTRVVDLWCLLQGIFVAIARV